MPRWERQYYRRKWREETGGNKASWREFTRRRMDHKIGILLRLYYAAKELRAKRAVKKVWR